MLITKVAVPMLQPVTLVMPCPSTVQGLTPDPDAINIASPSPKMMSPALNITIETIGGLIVSAFGELQNKVGIVFTLRKSGRIFIAIILCGTTHECKLYLQKLKTAGHILHHLRGRKKWRE